MLARPFEKSNPTMMRFDRFTERLQDAAARANEILMRYGHNQIDVEHFLLALLEQPDGVIPQVLEDQRAVPRRYSTRFPSSCITSCECPSQDCTSSPGASPSFERRTPQVLGESKSKGPPQ